MHIHYVNMVLNVHKAIRLIKDGEKRGGGGKGVEVGEEGDYIPIPTLSPPPKQIQTEVPLLYTGLMPYC